MTRRRTARTLMISPLESLEDRLVLTAIPGNVLEGVVALKGGPAIGAIYNEFVDYVQAGSKGTFTSPESASVVMAGQAVGVDIRFGAGNFATNVSQMQAIGMLVTAQVPSLGIVEGFVPIGQLPSVALDPNLSSLSPVYRPTAFTDPIATQTAAVTLKGGPTLGNIFQEFANYEQSGAVGPFTPMEASRVEFAGNAVKVDIRATQGNYSALLQEMQNLGMLVTATAPKVGLIEGYISIAQLPQVAADAHLAGMNPVYKPTNFGG